MVTMLLFAKTAFANPRWLRGARRFAGFLAPAPDPEDDRKAKHEASLVVFTAAVFTLGAFAPAAFGARRVAARAFPSRADAPRPSGAAACKLEALLAQALLLPVRFTSVLTVGVFVSIRIFVHEPVLQFHCAPESASITPAASP
jgi:hypothetical protein